jgi:hypothetical protein
MLRVREEAEYAPAYCDCCGNCTRTISGWIESGERTVAAYFVTWTEGRPDHGANFDLIIGTWGVVDPHARTGVALFYHPQAGGFAIIDASIRPFSHSQSLFSEALSRASAIGSPLAASAFECVDTIWLQDPRISEIKGFSSGVVG